MQYDILVQLKTLDVDSTYTSQYLTANQYLLADPMATPPISEGKLYTFQRRLIKGDSINFSATDLHFIDIKHVQLIASGPILINFGTASLRVTYMAFDFPAINSNNLLFTLSVPNLNTEIPIDVKVVILGRENPYIL